MGNLAYNPEEETYLLNTPPDTIMEGCCCGATPCAPCDSCISIAIQYNDGGTFYYMLTAMSGTVSGCRKTFSGSIELRDDNRGPLADMHVQVDITQTADYLYYKFTVNDNDYQHFYCIYNRADAPGDYSEGNSCAAWRPGPIPFSIDLYTPGPDDTLPPSQDDYTWTKENTLSGNIYLGPPCQDGTHKGLTEKYIITNTEEIDISPCSSEQSGLPWGGELEWNGSNGWYGSGDHYGASISALLTMSTTDPCGWKLTVECHEGDGAVLVDSYKREMCGGPDGTYGDLDVAKVEP